MKLLCLCDLLVTLNEIFPKEEKPKEEKTTVVSQGLVDLLPLLHGENLAFACKLRNVSLTVFHLRLCLENESW